MFSVFITRERKHSFNIQINSNLGGILINLVNWNVNKGVSLLGQYDEMIVVSKPPPFISKDVTPVLC